MNRPRLLDLYCGAGGATRGYQQAGFYVVGIDNKPQPHYCGDEFHQADALEFCRAHGREFNAIHASPPCQHYSMAGQQWRASGTKYPDLIAATRERLKATARPYIIENVPGAPLINSIMLNGAFFGLNLRRRRMFETSFRLEQPLLPSEVRSPFRTGRKPTATDPVVPVGHFSDVPRARREMGIDWMTGNELSQAIPPAYTEYIGRFLIQHIRGEKEL